MDAKKRLVKHYNSFRAAAGMCKKCRVKYLRSKSKDPDFVLCLKEVAKNISNQNIPLTPRHKKQLNRHGKSVKDILKDRNFHQSGGFLNIAVPILASLVGELIASKVGKK